MSNYIFSDNVTYYIYLHTYIYLKHTKRIIKVYDVHSLDGALSITISGSVIVSSHDNSSKWSLFLL